ncbi:MAG: pyridoxal 5'-phosphate synthase glutaminase subunit PdxT [Dehalococcoidia bacterium]|nr:pyridoxal 5'-phosphate synthase glutaminase subunit PdxT [Dehalococcoidia bacterium]
MKIGVLALQGDFFEHIETLKKLKVEAIPVRLPQELNGLNGLIIPGGESTTFRRLGTEYGLLSAIQEFTQNGHAVFGTCAGMILLAKKATDLNNGSLGLIDIEVKRNAFGRQVDSFEADLTVAVLGEAPFHAVFIRAPLIEKVGRDVEVLARLATGTPVAARQGKILVSSFHPELTSDLRFHAYFLNLVAAN